MEQLKKCQYCSKLTERNCSRCGAFVCEDHITKEGVCVKCKEGRI